MKKVVLLRHAKSSWKESGLTDFERPLNKRGKEDAPKMSEWFRSLNTFDGIIISSPARRARKTAEVMASTLGFKDRLHFASELYTFSDSSVYEEIVWSCPEKISDLMMVGHNEVISSFAEEYSEQIVERMVTCGMVCLEFDVKEWSEISPGKGKLIFQAYPKMFKEQS